MDPDLNKYDLEHAVTAHPKMSQREWEQIYWDAWQIYYTPEHIATILKRAKASGILIYRLMVIILWFASSLRVEKVHPLQGGILRFKNRHERRSSMPLESVFVFYPKFAIDFVAKHARIIREAWRIKRICDRVEADAANQTYTDIAMTPVNENDTENLEMFTHNKGARDAVVHINKIKTLTHAAE
jgi:hypothetical protein